MAVIDVLVDNICKTYKLTSVARTILIMPLFHIHGLVASFMSPLQAGSAIIIPPRFSPTLWQGFGIHNATWFTTTPTMHQILLPFPTPSKMPYIRFILSCSSPLSPKILGNLESRFGAPVFEVYAMTEVSHQITSNTLPPAPRHAGSVGVPKGDIELKI